MCALALAVGIASSAPRPAHASVLSTDLGSLDPTNPSANQYAGCVAATMVANGFVFPTLGVLASALGQLWPNLPNPIQAACRTAVDTRQSQVCLLPSDPSTCPGLGTAADSAWINQVATLNGWTLVADGQGGSGGYARVPLRTDVPPGSPAGSVTGTFHLPDYICTSKLSCPAPSPGLYSDCGPFSCGPITWWNVGFTGRTPATPGYPGGENTWGAHYHAVDGFGHVVADGTGAMGNWYWGGGCGGSAPFECGFAYGFRWNCLNPDGSPGGNCAGQTLTVTFTPTTGFQPGCCGVDNATVADFARISLTTDNLAWHPSTAQCGPIIPFNGGDNDCFTWNDPRLSYSDASGNPVQVQDQQAAPAAAAIDLASSDLACLIGVDAASAPATPCTDVSGGTGSLVQPASPPTAVLPLVTVLAPDRGPTAGGTQVTIGGVHLTGATLVSFGGNDLQPCPGPIPVAGCFYVINDGEIRAYTPRSGIGFADVTVTTATGTSIPDQNSSYAYEGWDLSSTPPDKSTLDPPVGQSASFMLVGWERTPMTIGHGPLPAGLTCSDDANPGQPAQVTCTIDASTVGLSQVSFFDATDSTRISTRTFVVGHGTYTALGDSFSAGEGVPTNPPPYFIPPTDDTLNDGNTCHRSWQAYSRYVASRLYNQQLAFWACSGAVTNDFYSPKYPSQPAQLSKIRSSDDLVTLSVGGNDFGFAAIATDCIATYHKLPGGCRAQYSDQIDGRLATLSTRLDALYSSIRAAAPSARVLVMGYPKMLPDTNPCFYVTPEDQAWLLSVEVELNNTIRDAATAHGFEFVSTYEAFTGHTLCTPDDQRWINNIGLSDRSYWIHPNDHGQQEFAILMLNEIGAGSSGKQYLVLPGSSTSTTISVPAGSGQLALSTIWPGSDVVLSAVAPSGRVITRGTNAADVHGDHGATYEDLVVRNPEAGQWTVQMYGASVSPDGEPVKLMAQATPAFDRLPTAVVSASASSGTAPLTVAFDGSASFDPDGHVASYLWEFGDGTTSADPRPVHTFTTPGDYTVALTVTDDAGGLGTSATSVLVREPTTLTIGPTQAGDYGDSVALSATLTSALDSRPLPGQAVSLGVGAAGCSGTTNAAGTATCTVTLAAAPGTYSETAGTQATDSLAAATASIAFVESQEETALTASVPSTALGGGQFAVSGTLTDDEGRGLAGRSVTFTGGSSACTAISDQAGRASCSLTASGPLGPTAVTATFAGDTDYRSSNGTGTVIFYAALASGTFVVGDAGAAAGGQVTYWASDWGGANPLVSGASVPSSFKGFAPSSGPACQSGWSAPAGNSAAPPAAVPTYMAVDVTSNVSKSGKDIVGDTVHVVVVRTDPGYGPAPGHTGTGTVVATVC